MKYLLLIIAFGTHMLLHSQVGINTTSPESTLDVRAENHLGTVSSNDGILVPRVNNLSVDGSVNGQLVFLIADNGTFTKGFHYWDGMQWVGFGGIVSDDWALTGNAGTTNGTNFLGTTDTQDLDIRTNNVITHRFTQKGQLEFLNLAESVYLGENAGKNLVETLFDFPTGSVFIGQNSGMSVTEAYYNNFIGYLSGENTTTGGFNSFFGGNSGHFNTTGQRNSFYGNSSGYQNTTGNQNSFFGDGSGGSNTIGTNNSFFGKSSGSFNTTGNFNSFFGVSSGLRNITASSNSYFGAFSGQDTTSGSMNSFFGSSSGAENTTGRQNSYVGSVSGGNTTTGVENVFFGASSGFSNISGSRNIFIGFKSGFNELNDDRLYIENSDATIPLIGGDFNLNRVGINRSIGALTNTLEVEGEASKTVVGAWAGNSDRRLKKNIETINGQQALEKIFKMRGVTYEWNDTKTGNNRPTTMQYGFIAQELMKVFPNKVSKDVQGYYQTAYGDYDAIFVQAIKELSKSIDTKDEEINKLKEQNKAFEARLEALELLLDAKK